MKTKIAIAVAIVVVVAAVLGGTKAAQFLKLGAGAKAAVVPPEYVSSAVVRADKWQGSLHTIGSVNAVQGVSITTELAGTVTEIAFESGAVVARGDLLVRLNTASEEAQLRAVEAQVDLARLNSDRMRLLRTDNMVSQSDLDSAEATLKQKQADADAIRAVIEKKTLRAPFAGKLGIRQVNLGQYLDNGDPVVSLQALSPVYCDFTLPQQELARLQPGMRVRLNTDTYPDKNFDGSLTAINPDLDSATRSVRLQATYENAEQLLRPGMFARVEVLLPEERPVLVVPATAVLSSPFGDSVFVIEPPTNGASGLIVRQQFIRTSGARGDFVSVEAGLKSGERVVSAGVLKLRNGISVIENNEVAPKATESPRPSDS
jgi:membrane fusion protein (multidrug efflux system)